MAISHRFSKAAERWWQKPLVAANRPLPAELVVLRAILREGESGAWLNSSSVRSGVVDLIRDPTGKFKTSRATLPEFVAASIQRLYIAAGVAKGMLDLVIWNRDNEGVRFVEVKCPHWDKPTKEQTAVMTAAISLGYEVDVAEWEFIPSEY